MSCQVARPLRKARAVNCTDTTFPSRPITATEPSGAGASATDAFVDRLAADGGGGIIPKWLFIMPFGAGANDTTLDIKIIGWRRILISGQTLWFPQTLALLGAVLSTAVGPGAPLPATDVFADTLSITAPTGEPNITNDVTRFGTFELYSPANNTHAWCKIPLNGCSLWEPCFDVGTATSGNLLYTFLE